MKHALQQQPFRVMADIFLQDVFPSHRSRNKATVRAVAKRERRFLPRRLEEARP